jgi:hypothetical protein
MRLAPAFFLMTGGLLFQGRSAAGATSCALWRIGDWYSRVVEP